MKKNFFSNAVALAAIMLAGLSLNSCDEKDNAIIDGKVWVKPEVTLTDGGAIVTASSPDDISRMIGRVRQEMAAAAQNGETFTLDIDAPVLNATSSDNTISIPTINGGDVVVNFKSAISTEVPLVLESKGVADDAVSTGSTNKVEINVPSASGIDLQINMPTTTVTLNAASGSLNIDELIAKTAWGTLNIESGVTVNWLKLKGGNAVVKDGGKVLGALMDNDFDVKKEGIRVYNVYKNELPTATPTDEDYFYVNKAKIIKREDGGRVYANVYQYSEDPGNEVEIVIADGARAETYAWTSTNYRPAVNIIGEGDAKLIGSGYKNEEGKIYPNNSDIALSGIKTMTGVTVDATHCLVFNDETKEYEELEVDEEYNTYLYAPQNSKDCKFYATWRISADGVLNNCSLTARTIDNINPNSENSTFKGRSISFTNYYVSGNSATVKNCKFETSDKEPYASIAFPYQTKDRTSFDFIFDTCDFAKGFKFITSYEGWKPMLDKDGKLVTKAYCWFTLDENGNFPKNDNGEPQYWGNSSASESDIPAANKANGNKEYEWGYGYWDNEQQTMVYSNGYWIEDRPNGMTEKAYYKDFKGYLTLKNSTLDGKAITSKTDMIGGVDVGYNEKGEQATKTYYVIDGVTYEVIKIENEGKYRLIEAE